MKKKLTIIHEGQESKETIINTPEAPPSPLHIAPKKKIYKKIVIPVANAPDDHDAAFADVATTLPASVSALIKAPAAALVERSSWVKSRLIDISREVSTRYIENGQLLKEVRDKELYKDWEYANFDEAITCLHEAGQLDYGWRNARIFISVIEMIETQGITPEDVAKIPISKLRECASITDVKAQQKLLASCNDMDVAELQAEAKKLRAKAKGHDVDPLFPVTLMLTKSMRTFYTDCIAMARKVYKEPALTDTSILVDRILPEWFGSADTIEAEMIEAELHAG